MTVTPLASDVWVHTSYKLMPEYGPVLSNGLIVRADEVLYLIDTAWDDDQTEAVLAWARTNLAADIAVAVTTHAHADKMGGMPALKRAGITTYALDLTNQDARMRGLQPAEHALTLVDDVTTLAGGAIEIYYPGPGHTRDNIVVYVGAARVLFGGCLIRPGGSQSMGNTADGDVDHWDDAVAAVKARYHEADVIVPSHGPPGGPALLDHTIALARQAASNQSLTRP